MFELYPWQQPIADRMIEELQKSDTVVLAAGTGVGKTYLSCYVAARLGRRLFVVAPKTILTAWRRVAEGFGCDLRAVTNPEQLVRSKNCLHYANNKWLIGDEPFLMVFDEPHKYASGKDSKSGKVLAMSKALPDAKIILSSATPAVNPLQMRASGYLLGLHQFNAGSFYNFCRRYGCLSSPFHSGLEFTKHEGRAAAHMEAIAKWIGGRMIKVSVNDIPGFPESEVQVDLRDVTPEERLMMDNVYTEMRAELKEVKKGNPRVNTLRERQRLELMKVPMLTELITGILEEDAAKAVVVMVNFRETLGMLRLKLPESAIIWGEQKDRDEQIRRFQCNEVRVCLATIGAGGVGVSLHDEQGGHPRTSVILPSWSAAELVQALGRIHRAGSKSKAVQIIPLVAGTVEEQVYKSLHKKMHNLEALLTDSDLAPW